MNFFSSIQSIVLYQNGQAVATHADQEHKQEKYKLKPNLGELNVLAN